MLVEMLAGIILGPPVLNIIRPSAHIEWLAELGIFFLMFFTGMEIDLKKLKKTSKRAILVAFGGTMVPFLAGYFITIAFKGTVFQALFIGMATSVTSIATKGRILHELGLLKTKLGHMMVNAALYDNIFSLVLFAIIVSLVKVGKINVLAIGKLSLELILFFVFTFIIGYYIFPRLEKQFSHKGAGGFTFCLIVALMFGFFAELVGLHFIVGVFIAGIFVRKDVMRTTKLYNRLFETMYVISYGFLGPIFFITLSFHINFKILFTDLFGFLLALTIGAILGKVLGAGLFARMSGLKTRESLLVGFAMNGRGMIEIILVVIGIELGILNDNIVSVLVFIAMVTTLVTPIALRLIVEKKGLQTS
jgi:Na+:H+ antiporter